jgi:hypothetical protein
MRPGERVGSSGGVPGERESDGCAGFLFSRVETARAVRESFHKQFSTSGRAPRAGECAACEALLGVNSLAQQGVLQAAQLVTAASRPTVPRAAQNHLTAIIFFIPSSPRALTTTATTSPPPTTG